MLNMSRIATVVIAAGSLLAISGCANYEVNTKRGNIPGYYIRKEMQESDRAVEAARQAGKDKQCPNEFKAAEDAKDKAYDVFRACRTEEGVEMAKKATAQANALCPAQPAKPAPTASLSANPGTVQQGQQSTLRWSSQNTDKCTIEPGVGPVPPQGSMTVTPAADTNYTLNCEGASSNAMVAVAKPSPTAPAAPTSTISVNPAGIEQGKPATLAWSSKNADKCTIEPGIGPVPPQGSMTITPSADTNYTINCEGPGGNATSAAKIDVAAAAQKAAPKEEKVTIALEVEFKTGKADIQSKYHDEIGKVAEFMKTYPEATGVIEGHTDNVGSKDANMKLSQRRADSVRKYLIDKYGIDGKRLTAKGYGPTKPIADNKTAAGRQKNRRTVASFDTMTAKQQ
jgi:OOP family OmpA-OmpF porin